MPAHGARWLIVDPNVPHSAGGNRLDNLLSGILADSLHLQIGHDLPVNLALVFQVGGTGGFFSASPSAAGQTMNCVNNLLRLDKDWKV